MYQSVGEVYLQTIGKLRAEPSSQTVNQAFPINQPFPVSESEKKRLREIEIRGYLFNDGKKTRKEYASDLDALMGRYAGYNRIQMEDIDGYAEISHIEIRNAAEQLNTYLIYAKIKPKNEYNCLYQYRQYVIPTTHTLLQPSYIVLPYGVASMDITNKSSEVLHKDKKCVVVTPEGNLPVFEIPDMLEDSNAIMIADVVDEDNSSKYKSYVLDLGTDYVRWNIVPGVTHYSGNVKAEIYARINNSDSEVVTVTITENGGTTVLEQNFTVTSHEWVKLTTNAVKMNRYSPYTVSVNKTGTGEVHIDGIRMVGSDDIRHIRFETPAPNMNMGECKVYDTVTADEIDKTNWKRVYTSSTYKFTGHIVVENATMQWRIDPTALWKNTGIFTDRISNKKGTFYPEEFKETEVHIGIHDIKPDEIVLGVYLRNDTGKQNIAIVYVTPLTVYVKVTPRVSIDSAVDWKFLMPDSTSIGGLNGAVKSRVLFNSSSSVSMISNKQITENYVVNGFTSYNGTTLNAEYTFALSVLPRVTDNTGKLYHSKAVSGADYYVDGEFIDTGKTIYLSDFINSLYQNGLMIGMRIAHKMYGDEAWI